MLLGAVNNYSLSQVLHSTAGRGGKKSMATRNPILDTRMSRQNFNWNLVSCLIGLMNYSKVKVRWCGGENSGLVRIEKTDGAKKCHCFSERSSSLTKILQHWMLDGISTKSTQKAQ